MLIPDPPCVLRRQDGADLLKSAQIPALTGLRLFAALAIVLTHSQTGYFLRADTFFPLSLVGAVPLFFVLSGFVLTLNVDSTRRTSDFLAARIGRIWPSHVAAIGFMFLIFAPYSTSLIQTAEGVQNLILNALLLQAWSPNSAIYWSFNQPSWSVSCELFFYVAFPTALARLSTRPILSVAAVVGLTILGTIAINAIFPSVDPNWLGSVNPLTCFTGFVIGIAACTWHARRPRHATAYGKGTAIQIATLALALAMNIFFARLLPALQPPALRAYMSFFGPAPFYALLILALTRYRGAVSRLLEIRAIVYGGEISYCLYLFHQLIIRWHSVHRADFTSVPMWLQYAGVLVASFVIAAAAHHLIEKPGRRLVVSSWQTILRRTRAHF